MNIVFCVLANLLLLGTVKAQVCFSSNAELKQAVDDYVLDPANSTSEVALRYGWPMNAWCVENLQDFGAVFSGGRNGNLRSFDEDISGWNTTSATTMWNMFSEAQAFNQPLEGWKTSRVTVMDGMFYLATSFNQPLEGWDTSGVTSMYYMFGNAQSFNQPLEGWKTSGVTTMEGMFDNALLFNQPLEGWDTSGVKTMKAMFYNAQLFNKPLQGWNTSSVTTMYQMFYQASLFNQGLCPWGPELQGRSVDTGDMFFGTSCPITSPPELTASPPGPFCVECSPLIVPSPQPSNPPSITVSVAPTLAVTFQPTEERCPCGRFRLLCRLIRFRVCVPYNK